MVLGRRKPVHCELCARKLILRNSVCINLHDLETPKAGIRQLVVRGQRGVGCADGARGMQTINEYCLVERRNSIATLALCENRSEAVGTITGCAGQTLSVNDPVGIFQGAKPDFAGGDAQQGNEHDDAHTRRYGLLPPHLYLICSEK